MRVGDKFAGGRYTVLQKLGWGHFSTVWLVLDSDTGQHAALKVKHESIVCPPLAPGMTQASGMHDPGMVVHQLRWLCMVQSVGLRALQLSTSRNLGSVPYALSY